MDEHDLVLSIQTPDGNELSRNPFDEGKLVLLMRIGPDTYAMQLNIENRSQLYEDFLKQVDAILQAKNSNQTDDEQRTDSSEGRRSLS